MRDLLPAENLTKLNAAGDGWAAYSSPFSATLPNVSQISDMAILVRGVASHYDAAEEVDVFFPPKQTSASTTTNDAGGPQTTKFSTRGT